MITYYNHTHMTAVPTRLLLDTNLSAEANSPAHSCTPSRTAV